MHKPERPKPTEAELQILRVLWERGRSTVREVAEAMQSDRGGAVGYTTVLKLMQIMAEKGLVERDESSRTHVYWAAEGEDRTLGRLAKDLLDRAFGGSMSKLMVAALGAKRASEEELAEVQRLLEKASKDRKKGDE